MILIPATHQKPTFLFHIPVLIAIGSNNSPLKHAHAFILSYKEWMSLANFSGTLASEVYSIKLAG